MFLNKIILSGSLSIILYNTMALQLAKSSAEVMELLDIDDDKLNKLNSVSDLYNLI